MEILTNILRDDTFRQELRDAAADLARLGASNVTVAFGFAIDAPDLDDVGVAYKVAIADISSFVAERERTKGFHFGSIDCWVEASELDARFLFCNDRDVHLTSSFEELLNGVRARWRSKGFNVYPDDLNTDRG